MYAAATTTISILRGDDATDRYLDSEPSDSIAHSGVIASIISRSRVISSPDTSEPMTVTSITGRVGSGTDIQYNDRIKDERTGVIYQIMDMGLNQAPYNTPDIVLTLKQVASYGVG